MTWSGGDDYAFNDTLNRKSDFIYLIAIDCMVQIVMRVILPRS